MTMKINILGLIMILAVLAGCKDPETPTPDATFSVSIENVFTPKTFFASGVFNTPVGEASPGPAFPGGAYEFTFNAGKGSKLSFATMFVQSNDLFYAPSVDGIALYDADGNAISGDITDQIDLWDAGTEVNEEPGIGVNQAPRQAGANTGDDENGTVELISNVNDGFSYPTDESVIRVTITPSGDNEFTVNIANISDQGSFQTPFAPGNWVIHSESAPLFTEGEASSAGLEAVAEDGNAGILGDDLTNNSGLVSPFAPGVFLVHGAGEKPLFENGSADFGKGLEGLAEDGSPAPLSDDLNLSDVVTASGVFNTPVGASAPGPIFPGGIYEFTFDASEGDYLNLATMLVQSNDLFYAFEDAGIALFENGVPKSGDVTAELRLWDAGTETNQFPGAGNDQAPRQAGADTGDDESGNVVEVSDSFTYPTANQVIKITISVQ